LPAISLVRVLRVLPNFPAGLAVPLPFRCEGDVLLQQHLLTDDEKSRAARHHCSSACCVYSAKPLFIVLSDEDGRRLIRRAGASN
jgi:hypothetical protein